MKKIYAPQLSSILKTYIRPLLFIILLFHTISAYSQTGLISNTTATSGRSYVAGQLVVGTAVYSDRTYQATSVPVSLNNAPFIKTPNDDKSSTATSLLSFNLCQSATVYVAYDPRAASLPSWLSTWQKLTTQVGINDPKISYLVLYSKNYPAGKVTLGGNLASPAAGALNMYLVIATTGGPSISASPLTIYDNDVAGGAVGINRKVTVKNVGSTVLTLSSINISGANTNQFVFSGLPTFPKNISAGASIAFSIAFNPSSAGLKTASININSNDAAHPVTSVRLRGLGTSGLGGANEPSLQAILNLLEVQTNVGDDNVSTAVINSSTTLQKAPLLGDEVSIQKFKKAGVGNVTITPLDVFGPTTNSTIVGMGWYKSGLTSSSVELLSVSNNPVSNGQTVNVNFTGILSFDPSSNSFGFYSRWPVFSNRHLYSEDNLNTFAGAIPHHVRVYPYKKNGTLVLNSYVVAFEEHTSGFDYQDIVFIVNNVKPATSQSGTLEAEQALLSGAVVGSTQTGYTGSGYADYVNASGDYIEWTVNATTAGSFSLKFRYANGGTTNRPLQLKVNGTVVNASLAFNPSGSWATWAVSSATANLIAGANKIRLTTTGSNGGNVDNLAFSSNSSSQSLQRSVADNNTLPVLPATFKAHVVPNPVIDNAKLKLYGSSNLPVDLQLIDMSGRTCKVFKLSNKGSDIFDFSVSDLAPGSYTIIVKQGNLITNARVIIERK
ncbi:MAG: choice-of-anchor D domain-containing protein [Ginsengibacter sp.]